MAGALGATALRESTIGGATNGRCRSEKSSAIVAADAFGAMFSDFNGSSLAAMFGLAAGLANADWASGSPPKPGFKPNRLSSESPPARAGRREARNQGGRCRTADVETEAVARAATGTPGCRRTARHRVGRERIPVFRNAADRRAGRRRARGARDDETGAFDGFASKPNAASGSGMPGAGRAPLGAEGPLPSTASAGRRTDRRRRPRQRPGHAAPTAHSRRSAVGRLLPEAPRDHCRRRAR